MQLQQHKKWWITGLIIIVIIFAIVVLVHRLHPKSRKLVVKPIPVQLVTAKIQNTPLVAQAIGRLVTTQSIILQAQQTGEVTATYVRDGQYVHQNQLILTIENTPQLAAYNQALASYWNAKQAYGRAMQLNQYQKGIEAQSDVDAATATYRQAEATLMSAKKNLAETRVVAPFSGNLGVMQVTAGSYVQTGDQLVPLVNRQTLYAQYSLPQTDYALVRIGQKVDVTTASYPGKTFHGLVTYIAPQVDQNSSAFQIRAKIDNRNNQLSPGMLIQIQHVLIPKRNVLVIPAISLVPGLQGYSVFRIKNGKVYATHVVVGERFQQWVVITSGLQAGDQVIASGNTKAQLGNQVTVVKSS